MAAVEPEIIAVLVDEENLGGDTERQRPFPFEHDGLAGADDAHESVAIGGELAVEPAASVAAAIVGGAVDAGVGGKALGQTGVAGDEVDGDIVAPGIAEAVDDAFE